MIETEEKDLVTQTKTINKTTETENNEIIKNIIELKNKKLTDKILLKKKISYYKKLVGSNSCIIDIEYKIKLNFNIIKSSLINIFNNDKYNLKIRLQNSRTRITNQMLNNWTINDKNNNKDIELNEDIDSNFIFNEKSIKENIFFKRIFYFLLSQNLKEFTTNIKEFLFLFDNKKNLSLNFNEFKNLIYYIEKKCSKEVINTIFETITNSKLIKYRHLDKLFFNDLKNKKKSKFGPFLLNHIFNQYKTKKPFQINNSIEQLAGISEIFPLIILFFFFDLEEKIVKRKDEYYITLGINKYKKEIKFNKYSFYQIFKEIDINFELEKEIEMKTIEKVLYTYRNFNTKYLSKLNMNNLLSDIAIKLKDSVLSENNFITVGRELSINFLIQKFCNKIIANHTKREINNDLHINKVLLENVIWNEIKFEEINFNKAWFVKTFAKKVNLKVKKDWYEINILYNITINCIKVFFPLIDDIVF